MKNQPKFLILTSNLSSYPGIFGCPLILKALENSLWDLELINLYDFGIGKHKKIDDHIFGGGDGLLISPVVIENAINFVKAKYPDDQFDLKFFASDPSGKIFDQNYAYKIFSYFKQEEEGEARQKIICFLCSRFEGVDVRVFEYFNFEKISLGKFVITNGDLAMSIIMNSVLRLVPGVLGKKSSSEIESFSNLESNFSEIEFDQFTKPRIWNGLSVPEVLLSGNHKEIENWRKKNSQKNTLEFQKKNLS
jgi:tRNA (guanine37-N1)-methyltransferase